jgi:hypothetical protein
LKYRLKKSQILFISGPSGSGKSTFIRQLRAGNLAQNIADCLPPSCADWSVIELNDIQKGDLCPIELRQRINAGESLILHYDIVFNYCRVLRPGAPVHSIELFDDTIALYSVFIRPKKEVLSRQFDQRNGEKRKTKSLLSRLCTIFVRRPLRKLRSIGKNEKITTTQELYKQHDFVDKCYMDWDSYLANLHQDYHFVSQIVIEPTSADSDEPSFRLLQI